MATLKITLTDVADERGQGVQITVDEIVSDNEERGDMTLAGWLAIVITRDEIQQLNAKASLLMGAYQEGKEYGAR